MMTMISAIFICRQDKDKKERLHPDLKVRSGRANESRRTTSTREFTRSTKVSDTRDDDDKRTARDQKYKDYSKSYLRHLTISNEMLGAQISSIHNLAFYLWLMEEARNKINEGTFTEWKNKMVKKLDKRL